MMICLFSVCRANCDRPSSPGRHRHGRSVTSSIRNRFKHSEFQRVPFTRDQMLPYGPGTVINERISMLDIFLRFGCSVQIFSSMLWFCESNTHYWIREHAVVSDNGPIKRLSIQHLMRPVYNSLCRFPASMDLKKRRSPADEANR